MTFTLGYDAGLIKGIKRSGPGSFEAQLSISIRDKERRQMITDVEAW